MSSFISFIVFTMFSSTSYTSNMSFNDNDFYSSSESVPGDLGRSTFFFAIPSNINSFYDPIELVTLIMLFPIPPTE
jgi:hypothetical protein